MKTIFAVLLILLSLPALAQMDRKGNGGDPQEILFKNVAGNIAEWIRSGSSSGLLLPPPLSQEVYKKAMLAALENYEITFTEQVLAVDGVEKTCLNYAKAKPRAEIQCNISRFGAAYEKSVDQIYRLVHHEFAGIAGFEVNAGGTSDYRISDQISEYLRYETIRRLPVRSDSIGRKKYRLSITTQYVAHKFDSKNPDIKSSYQGLNLTPDFFNTRCGDVEFKPNENGDLEFSEEFHTQATSTWSPGLFAGEVKITLKNDDRQNRFYFSVKLRTSGGSTTSIDFTRDLDSYLHLFTASPFMADLHDRNEKADGIFVIPQVVVASCR